MLMGPRVDTVDTGPHTVLMTQTALPTKPLNREPLCSGCEYTWRPPVPGTTRRFGVWWLEKVSPECTAHGYMTRINLAADLRYGD